MGNGAKYYSTIQDNQTLSGTAFVDRYETRNPPSPINRNWLIVIPSFGIPTLGKGLMIVVCNDFSGKGCGCHNLYHEVVKVFRFHRLPNRFFYGSYQLAFQFPWVTLRRPSLIVSFYSFRCPISGLFCLTVWMFSRPTCSKTLHNW